MRKLIYVLFEQEATDKDKEYWDRLKKLADDLIHATADFYEVHNQDILYELEAELVTDGWIKFIPDNVKRNSHSAIELWVKTID